MIRRKAKIKIHRQVQCNSHLSNEEKIKTMTGVINVVTGLMMSATSGRHPVKLFHIQGASSISEQIETDQSLSLNV